MKNLIDIRRQIEPVLQKVERFRLEKLTEISKAKKWYYIPITFLIIGLLSLLAFLIPIAVICGVLAIIGFIIVFAFKVGPHKTAYISTFKQEVFFEFIKHLYPETYYAPANYLPSNLFSQSKLFGGYDSYNGEDYFEGKTESGCPFKFSELYITRTDRSTDSEGNTTTSTTIIFDGLFFVLEVPNRVGIQVQVLPDSAEKGFGFVGKFLQKTVGSFFQGAKMVYMEEHPEFEKEFVVYCTDEAEAFRVLTPTLLQAICDLRYKWNSKLSISFIDNQIFIALSTKKNFFEPDIHKTVLDDKLIHDLYDELALCLSVIENLSVESETSFNPEKKMWEKPGEDNNHFNNNNNSSNSNPFLL